MRVQRVRLPDGKVSWMVLGDDLLPVEPIQKYLSYIENLQKSPNTLQSYAYHLKLFWEFLRDSRRLLERLTIGKTGGVYPVAQESRSKGCLPATAAS